MPNTRAPQRRGPRLFVEGLSASVGEAFNLGRDDSHYLRDVLRLAPGDPLELGDKSSEKVFQAVVQSVGEQVAIKLLEVAADQSASRPDLCLLFALCKGSKNDLVCDWATELGCTTIIFWQAERSVVRLRGAEEAQAKCARLAKIAQSAAQQSRQPRPPAVHVSASLEEALQIATAIGPALRITCSLAAGATPLPQLLSAGLSATVVVVGPEGDLSGQEESMLSSAGFTQASLGPNTLRSELAAVSALCLVRR